MVSMRTDRRVRPTTMEATDNGKTRSHRLGVGARRGGGRECAERVFRDIHGAEHHRHATTVLVVPALVILGADFHRTPALSNRVPRRSITPNLLTS